MDVQLFDLTLTLNLGNTKTNRLYQLVFGLKAANALPIVALTGVNTLFDETICIDTRVLTLGVC